MPKPYGVIKSNGGALFTAGRWNNPGEKTMKRFEYKLVPCSIDDDDEIGPLGKKLTKLGADGWELVNVADEIAFMKREAAVTS